ncbi:hypothetical protein BGX27_004450 [Mortierella sp. AM989]|nr:hypothetical protein BGX27_004450 [Mortierella sp. AM989]
MGAADSKLAFKKGVFRLFEERNIPYSANDYWEQFWVLPESVEDVFQLVSSQDIRRVRDEARENLECLIEKVLAQLFQLSESSEFLTSLAPAGQVLNCVRILTRIFPFIFESEDFKDWEEHYFWTPLMHTEKATQQQPESDEIGPECAHSKSKEVVGSNEHISLIV